MKKTGGAEVPPGPPGFGVPEAKIRSPTKIFAFHDNGSRHSPSHLDSLPVKGHWNNHQVPALSLMGLWALKNLLPNTDSQLKQPHELPRRQIKLINGEVATDSNQPELLLPSGAADSPASSPLSSALNGCFYGWRFQLISPLLHVSW